MPYGKSVNLNKTPGANIGSKVTPKAMQKAMDTASMPRQSSSSSPPQDSKPAAKLAASRSSIHRGSRAGLKDHKNVWIQPNGSGYLNQSNQTARLKNRTKTLDVTPPSSRTPALTGFNKTFDSRLYSSEKSSACLLKKRMS